MRHYTDLFYAREKDVVKNGRFDGIEASHHLIVNGRYAYIYELFIRYKMCILVFFFKYTIYFVRIKRLRVVLEQKKKREKKKKKRIERNGSAARNI